MRKFCKKQNFIDLLSKTAAEDPRARAMMESQRLPAYVEKARGTSRAQSPESAFRTIMEGMADYLREYPAPPSYKQGLWETCKGWVDRIADELKITDYDFSEEAPEPVLKDTGIALVKALHPSKGKTKEELSRELGVSKKTIQTGLRALDPRLSESEKGPATFRIAGQEMRVKIDCETDEKTGTRWYHTANRLHPIALQLNTMQVGNLLRALQEIDAAPDQRADNEVCRMIAVDIWAQLSSAARDRLKKVYRSRYPEFGVFMEELEDAADNSVMEFRTEREMEPELEIRQQLEMSMKGNRPCSLTLKRDGQEIQLQNVVIDWTTGDESYLAIPADAYPDRETAVRFWLEEVEDYLVFDR